MNARRFLARIIHELNIASLPVIVTHEHCLESDCITDGCETEDDGADLDEV